MQKEWTRTRKNVKGGEGSLRARFQRLDRVRCPNYDPRSSAGRRASHTGVVRFLQIVEAIVEAVERGERSPLDFRWFVGVRKDICTDDGSWHPVACARPVALKQCLGLPKPLWHEVLELCGGELAELSRIELLKRDDLQ